MPVPVEATAHFVRSIPGQLCEVPNLKIVQVYHRERILETSTLSCNEEEEEITKPPKR
jgi:hypothetical protein